MDQMWEELPSSGGAALSTVDLFEIEADPEPGQTGLAIAPAVVMGQEELRASGDDDLLMLETTNTNTNTNNNNLHKPDHSDDQDANMDDVEDLLDENSNLVPIPLEAMEIGEEPDPANAHSSAHSSAGDDDNGNMALDVGPTTRQVRRRRDIPLPNGDEDTDYQIGNSQESELQPRAKKLKTQSASKVKLTPTEREALRLQKAQEALRKLQEKEQLRLAREEALEMAKQLKANAAALKAAEKAKKEEERLAKAKEIEEARLKREEEKRQKEEDRRQKEEETRKRMEEKKLRDEVDRARRDETTKRREEEKRAREEKMEEDKKKKEEERLRAERAKQKQAKILTSFFTKPAIVVDAKPEAVKNDLFKPLEVGKWTKLAPCVRSNRRASWKLCELKEPDADEAWLTTIHHRKHAAKLRFRTYADSGSDLTLTMRLFQFHENTRPAYFGTWSKKSDVITPKEPWRKETDSNVVDYENDSEADWEEEDVGESIGGSDAGDDGEEELEKGEDDEEEDGFVVPHGYLSEDEGVDGEDVDVVDKLGRIGSAGDLPETEADRKKRIKSRNLDAETVMRLAPKPIVLMGPIWNRRPVSSNVVATASATTTAALAPSAVDATTNKMDRAREILHASRGRILKVPPPPVVLMSPAAAEASAKAAADASAVAKAAAEAAASPFKIPSELVGALLVHVHRSRESLDSLVDAFYVQCNGVKVTKHGIRTTIQYVAKKERAASSDKLRWMVQDTLLAQYKLDPLHYGFGGKDGIPKTPKVKAPAEGTPITTLTSPTTPVKKKPSESPSLGFFGPKKANDTQQHQQMEVQRMEVL